MTNTLAIYYTDEDGKKGTHTAHVAEAVTDPSDAGIETLVQAIAACSNAGITKMSLLSDTANVDVAGNGPYDASDKLNISMSDTIGNVTQLVIPAPNRAILLDNDEQLDKNNSLWEDFKAELIIFLVAKGGELLLEYLRSKRNKRSK